MQWWISRPSITLLPYCYRIVVYGVGFIWSLLGDVEDSGGVIACWPSHFRCQQNGYLWMAAPHCLMWCLWRERNNRTFKDTKRTMLDLKLIFFRTLLDWISVLRSLSLWSINDLIDLCNLCDWLYNPQLYTSCIGWLCFLYQ